jgi:peptidoglycan/xylan/chitin deacetylase (PgdA/CDA1 family)
MWNDSIIESMRQAPAGELDLGRLGLPAPTIGDLASRRMAAAKVIQAIKHRSPDERDASVRELADVTGARLPDDLMMTSAQIAALHAAGMEIGGHTVSHPILAVVDDDRARREMADGREALSAMIRAPVKLFAYPNGRPGTDYDARHVRMARDLGFTGAFSTASGSADPFSDFFQIPRYMPWDRSRWRFVARVIENYRRPASALA